MFADDNIIIYYGLKTYQMQVKKIKTMLQMIVSILRSCPKYNSNLPGRNFYLEVKLYLEGYGNRLISADT